MIDTIPKEVLVKRLLATALLVGLAILCYKIVSFFIIPALWAAIIAYITFPLYNFFQTKAKFSPTLSALTMTATVFVLFGGPVIIGVFLLHNEATSLYSTILNRVKYGYLDVPYAIKQLPIIGVQIQDALQEINNNTEVTIERVTEWVKSNLYYGKIAFDAVLSTFAKFCITFMTLFFFYRDGDSLISQIHYALRKIVGNRIDGYMKSIGATTQAVVYGIGLTALVQALLAGVGYYFADAPSPLLLMLVTFVFSLIPFGTPFVWGGVSIWLLTNGHSTEALGLFLWGACVISWVDNVIRPFVISGATQVPFIIIFIGVLGGLSAFGFVGLFIGPVILAIAIAVWREWVRSANKQLPTNQEDMLDKA